MTPFELGILAVATIGFVIPAWLAVLTYMRSASKPQVEEPNKRYFAYAELLKSLHAQLDLNTRTVRNGPLFAATVRELAKLSRISQSERAVPRRDHGDRHQEV
ncbi:MAG: hypothetical protein WBA51_02265 [Erythrobacter sp.]